MNGTYGKQELIQTKEQVTRINYPVTQYEDLNNAIFSIVNACRLGFELNSKERQFSYTQYNEKDMVSFLFTCYEYNDVESMTYDAITYNSKTNSIVQIQNFDECEYDDTLTGNENFYYNKDTIYIPSGNTLHTIQRINPISVDIDSSHINEERTIDPNKKMIALTFDDGPNSRYTPQILDILEKHHAIATFFVIGQQISSHEEVIKRMIEVGNQIGIHTFTHRNLTKLKDKDIKEEITQSATLLKQFNYTSTLVRPPYGAYNQQVIDSIDYPLILWNIDTRDWESLNTQSIVKLVKENVADGDIILFHDMYPTTVDAIQELVPYLLDEDYQLVTINELKEYRQNSKIKQKDSNH